MIKRIYRKNNILTLLAFSLITTSVFATQVNFIDQLSDNDHQQMKIVAQKVVGKEVKKGTELYGFFDNYSPESSEHIFNSFTINDLIKDSNLFNKSMPAMVTNGSEEDSKESFLNLLGFGGKYFNQKINKKTALTQYMPTMHIRTVNGHKNIFFESPAFTDSLFAETINYYDSLSGLSHYIPTSISNQKKHDQLLAYAFLGKGGSNIEVNGLSEERGKNGARLPVVELIGKYLANKLISNNQDLFQDDKIVFSGSGFAGAIAQEVAYQTKKSKAEKNIKVITSQAMRYLAGDFARDYTDTLGENNVFSINTSRKRSMETRWIGYKSVYFNALGTQIRLETEAPTNGILDGLFWRTGLTKARFDENHKGVLFKTNETPDIKVKKILGDKLPEKGISNAEFAKITPILVDISETQSQSSSNALATLISGDMFLKTSKGRGEHDNLVKIRKQFKIDENKPTLLDIGNGANMVIPASYYDPIHDLTVTVAHAAGTKSAHDNLKNILGKNTFKQAASSHGKNLGRILQSLHAKTGRISHGDFHLNNIRFDDKGNAYVIDVETLANNYIDENVRDSNSFRDILDLIAKTTSHIYKSGTYGASKGILSNFFGNKPSEAEKEFANGVLKGYIESLDKNSLASFTTQYQEFSKKYNKNVNKYLNGGIFSTYNNSIFSEIFTGNVFEEMLTKCKADLQNKVVTPDNLYEAMQNNHSMLKSVVIASL